MIHQMWAGLFSGENTVGKGVGFHPALDLLDCPKYVDYRKFGVETELSGRMLRALSTHVCAVLSASTEKRRKLLWKQAQKESGKYWKFSGKGLGKALRKTRPVKPCFNNADMRLDSLCSDVREGFIQLKSLGKTYGRIRIPFGKNRVAEKWKTHGKLLSGVEVSEHTVRFNYEIPRTAKNRGGETIGIDQGLLTVATLSNGNTTPAQCPHGHSLSSILDKMSRKMRGTKNFQRAQEHRKNFINWSVNALNLRDAGEVRLEKIWNIGYGKGRSRKLSHWTNTLIRDKIAAVCEMEEVPLVLQNCTYRSQRCSRCGMVRKSNRRGKEYSCAGCGYTADADYNASCNHAADLPSVSYILRKKNLNRKGFLWKPSGFYTLDGLPLVDSSSEELSVPRADNNTPRHTDGGESPAARGRRYLLTK